MKRILPWALPFLGAALLQAQDIQNMDFSTVFGYAPSSSKTVPGYPARLETTGGFAMGFVYGYQFKQTTAGSFWLDMSQVFSFGDYEDLAAGRTFSNTSWFFAPGLRYQLPLPNDRFAFYLISGFGYGNRYDYRLSSTSPATLQYGTQHSWTAPAGAGFIVRLSARTGFKTEFRDFITPSGRGTASNNHNLFLLFGISRHF